MTRDNGRKASFRVEQVAMVGQEELRFLHPTKARGSLGRIGDYEILGLLGRGGMGLVFKAFDASLSRVVAIKVLAPRLASSSSAHRRFLREARAAAAINHANVVTIHGVGEQEGMPFLVMECIAGQSLSQRIKSGPPLSVVQILRISLQIAQGLDAAQRQVVIHRDIKPANIMLEDNIERVKITDFGLARAAISSQDATSTDRIAGTPDYMSPEQVRGDVLDARSDLFSLGTVMYAMVAGASPFKGKHPLITVKRVTDVTPARLDELDPTLPRGLADLVERLMSKNVDDRPSTAEEVVEAIRQLLLQGGYLHDSTESDPGRPPSVPPPMPRPVKKSLQDDDVTEVMPEPKTAWWPRLPEGAMGLAAPMLLLALAGAILFCDWWRERNQKQLPFEEQPRVNPVASGKIEAGEEQQPTAPLIRVSQDGAGDCLNLQQALTLVTEPFTTIRIEDGGTYDGLIKIENSQVHRGLTIEAGSSGDRPKLRGPGPRNELVKIEGTPGVTLRGLEIASASDQAGLVLCGFIPGLTIEDVHFTKREPPGPEEWSHVWVREAAQGDADAPFRFVRCRFSPWLSGLVLQGNDGGLISNAEIRECRFEGRTRQLELIQFVRDLKIEGNLFLNGSQAILLDHLTGASGQITIANNSFYRVRNWIDPASSSRSLQGMRIANNALLEVEPDDDLATNLIDLAESGWQFANNVWECSAETEPAGPAENACLRKVAELAVKSRDPESPDFLRPEAGSALLGGAETAGPIGAISSISGN